jgi:GTP-binding protein
LISNGDGESVDYALWKIEDRGTLFIGGGVPIYEGMIIGENSRENDMEINALRAKQLTNVRASGKDEAIRLSPPKLMTLEQAIAYIQDDERVEVTPKSIRLRKAFLDPNDRKREERKSEK